MITKKPFPDWYYKRIRDLTIGDVMEALNEGFYCICADGRISCVTNISFEER